MSILDEVYKQYGVSETSEPPTDTTDSSQSVSSVSEGVSPFEPEIDDLEQEAGDDWHQMSADEQQIETFRYLVRTARQIRAGVIPESYTSTTNCKNCGEVPVFQGCPPEVLSCPWCMNGVKGLLIPKRK